MPNKPALSEILSRGKRNRSTITTMPMPPPKMGQHKGKMAGHSEPDNDTDNHSPPDVMSRRGKKDGR